MINNAKKSIYIQTPYFAPDKTMTECLKIAALSGIDIRVIIPGKPDKKYVYYITLSNIEKLLKYGVKFYIYEGFIHSKTIVCDCEITSVGTSNFDIRIFSLNYEINAFTYDKSFSLKNVSAFLKDLESSDEIIYEKFKKRSLITKVLERFFGVFSYFA